MAVYQNFSVDGNQIKKEEEDTAEEIYLDDINSESTEDKKSLAYLRSRIDSMEHTTSEDLQNGDNDSSCIDKDINLSEKVNKKLLDSLQRMKSEQNEEYQCEVNIQDTKLDIGSIVFNEVVIYTKKLDHMEIFQRNLKELTAASIYNNINEESKPKLTNPKHMMLHCNRLRNVNRKSMNNLETNIRLVNEKSRSIEQNNNNLLKQTASVPYGLPDNFLNFGNNRRFLNLCRPVKIILKDVIKEFNLPMTGHNSKGGYLRKPIITEPDTLQPLIQSVVGYNFIETTPVSETPPKTLFNTKDPETYAAGPIQLEIINLYEQQREIYTLCQKQLRFDKYELSDEFKTAHKNAACPLIFLDSRKIYSEQCCWYKRESFLNYCVVNKCLSKSTIDFLRTKHMCKENCICCIKCKQINTSSKKHIETEKERFKDEKLKLHNDITNIESNVPMKIENDTNEKRLSLIDKALLHKRSLNFRKNLSKLAKNVVSEAKNYIANCLEDVLRNEIIIFSVSSKVHTANNAIESYELGSNGELLVFSMQKITHSWKKINVYKPVCCWGKREQVIDKLIARRLSPSVVKFMRRKCIFQKITCCGRCMVNEQQCLPQEIPALTIPIQENIFSEQFIQELRYYEPYKGPHPSIPYNWHCKEARHTFTNQLQTNQDGSNRSVQNINVNNVSPNMEMIQASDTNKALRSASHSNHDTVQLNPKRDHLKKSNLMSQDTYKTAQTLINVSDTQNFMQTIQPLQIPANNSSEPDQNEVNLIVSQIMKMFKGLQLKVNENGKVQAHLEDPSKLKSDTELTILNQIMQHAQDLYDKHKIMPGTAFPRNNFTHVTVKATTVPVPDKIAIAEPTPTIIYDDINQPIGYATNVPEPEQIAIAKPTPTIIYDDNNQPIGYFTGPGEMCSRKKKKNKTSETQLPIITNVRSLNADIVKLPVTSTVTNFTNLTNSTISSNLHPQIPINPLNSQVNNKSFGVTEFIDQFNSVTSPVRTITNNSCPELHASILKQRLYTLETNLQRDERSPYSTPQLIVGSNEQSVQSKNFNLMLSNQNVNLSTDNNALQSKIIIIDDKDFVKLANVVAPVPIIASANRIITVNNNPIVSRPTTSNENFQSKETLTKPGNDLQTVKSLALKHQSEITNPIDPIGVSEPNNVIDNSSTSVTVWVRKPKIAKQDATTSAGLKRKNNDVITDNITCKQSKHSDVHGNDYVGTNDYDCVNVIRSPSKVDTSNDEMQDLCSDVTLISDLIDVGEDDSECILGV